MFPIAFLASRKTDTKEDMLFENGIIRVSRNQMQAVMMQNVDKNMRKKIKLISDEQWTEIFESSVELMQINYEMAKKIIISDIIK